MDGTDAIPRGDEFAAVMANDAPDEGRAAHDRPVHFAFAGSRTTMRNVAMGPKKTDTIHQFKPLLPFVCARPAFMRERVNQPTAY